MRITRLAVALGITAAVLAVTTGPASAHVTIPDPAEKGGFSIVTFSVPTERPDADTTSVEVKLPEDHPLPFVSVQPKTGWTVKTTKRTLGEPIEAFGQEYTEVVDTVTWSGGKIGPGQFDTFSLSVGPLPDDVDELVFPTIQTYSSGEEVSWIEETPGSGEEPEHPAPTLQLVAAADDTGSSGGVTTTTTATGDGTSGTDDDDGTDPVAIAALVVGILAALLAGGALLSARKKPTGSGV